MIDTVTFLIAAITTAHKCHYLPSHIFLGGNFGLDQPSVVMLEQIRTVNQDELGPYIGTINDQELLNTITNSLKKTFGLWRYHTAKAEVRCLCSRCMHECI